MTSTPLTTSDISVIIPTLNEEKNIAPLADQIKGKVGEVIIVDGGSTDNTVIVAKQAGLPVVEGPSCRGLQLNLGAAASNGRVLLFLHADTSLPDGFGTDIVRLLSAKGSTVGAFSLAVKDGTIAMKIIAAIANLRSTYLRLPYGDQAFFLTKDHFNDLGCFPQVEIMEDFIFIRQARKGGRVITLSKTVTTSARRWQRFGVLRTTIINQLMLIGHFIGISPSKLASFYRR